MKREFKSTVEKLKDELGTTYRIEFPEVRVNRGESVTIRINWLTGEALLWEHGRLWTAIAEIWFWRRKFLKGMVEKRRELAIELISENERTARKLLETMAAEMKYPVGSADVSLTDVECRRIALNFPYSLQEIRRMFLVRMKGEKVGKQKE